MKLKIKYFAAMRDYCGKSEEVVDSQASTPQELLDEIMQRYTISLDRDSLKVAVNENYASFDTLLCEMDTIVYIPPVAGG